MISPTVCYRKRASKMAVSAASNACAWMLRAAPSLSAFVVNIGNNVEQLLPLYVLSAGLVIKSTCDTFTRETNQIS